MPRLEVDTSGKTPVDIFYEDHGSGRPVVLIHGWPLSSKSWEAQVGPLVDAGYRVVTYDWRGFGDSSRPYEGYDYDTLASDLRALLEGLNLRDVTLVGFSMGGGEVARYVGRFGTDRLHSAVLAGAVPPAFGATDGGAIDQATMEEWLQAIATDRLGFVEGFIDNFFAADGQQTVSDAVKRFAWQVASVASPKGTADCVKAFSTTDFREDLRKADLPVLVLHGAADAVVPFEANGERVPEFAPKVETVVVEGGPHGFNASHSQQFNEALLAFLAR